MLTSHGNVAESQVALGDGATTGRPELLPRADVTRSAARHTKEAFRVSFGYTEDKNFALAGG